MSLDEGESDCGSVLMIHLCLTLYYAPHEFASAEAKRGKHLVRSQLVDSSAIRARKTYVFTCDHFLYDCLRTIARAITLDGYFRKIFSANSHRALQSKKSPTKYPMNASSNTAIATGTALGLSVRNGSPIGKSLHNMAKLSAD